MAEALAALLKIIARPSLERARAGVLRATIPFIRLIGSHRGALSLDRQADRTLSPGVARWVDIARALLPEVTQVDYDTSAGIVEINHTGDDDTVSQNVELLLDVAAGAAGKFLLAGRDRLQEMRDKLASSLEGAPVDLADPNAAAELKERVARL